MTHLNGPLHEHDLPMAVLLVDESDRVESADSGVRALLGREVGECAGRRVAELLPHAELTHALAQVRGSTTTQCQLRVQLSEPPHELLVTLSLLHDGTPPRVVALLMVADDWRTESEERAARQFRLTLESVTSGFAHEVRNPIASILSITEAALFHLASGSPANGLLGRIPPLVDRVDKLIKQSLGYSRPRAPQRIRRTLVSLVDWSVELSQITASAVRLEIEIDGALGPVLVDPEQAEQMLVNLLCNARDAARSTVRLATYQDKRRSGSFVRLEVSDDGDGIDEAHQGCIFEPFFTTKANGTGLGLAIARDLARRNGGDLTLRSSSPRGSCFALLLEALPEHQARD